MARDCICGEESSTSSARQEALHPDVTTFNDLNFGSGNNMVGVNSGYGQLVAGTEYSVGVVYDPNGASTLSFAVLPTGGSLSTESWNLTNVGPMMLRRR